MISRDRAVTQVVRACALTAVLLPGGSSAAGIPARPDELTFGELAFEVPRAERYRHELPGGVVVYVVEEHALPLAKLQATFRTGAFREPGDRPGVAALTAELLRQGGTAKRTPEEFDERVDFLAAALGSGAGATAATASLDVLSSGLDEGLALLFEMLKTPRFDASRLAIEKDKVREAMKQRNDDANDIQAREWDWLAYGPAHYSTRRLTEADLDRITREDLAAFHRRTYGADHLILAVSGDVDTKSVLAQLAGYLRGWTAGEPHPSWPPPPPNWTPKPGIFRAEKEIPQGKVVVGHPGLQWKDYADPEMYALTVMNDILGGGGFTSRLTKRVRSDEGLAYGAGSRFGIGTFWPGMFEIRYASKNPTVALAAKIALEEVEKIRRAPVDEEEIQVSKSSFVERFPRAFESAAQIARTFAQDELVGRPHSYWTAYRDRIRAVGVADVQRVAEKYLDPDRLTLLVVGKWSEIEPGDANGRAKMAELLGGQAVELPVRDPMTLEPKP